MTQAAAVASAKRLKVEMERVGMRCSIELQSGRGADPWGVYTKYLRMWHHVASYYKPGGSLTPLLWLIKAGRGAPNPVPGPLCNGYLGFDGVYRIICMGEANHPGLGGPITIDRVYVSKNSARKPTWGTEVEGGYQAWGEIDRLGPDMLQYMGRADVALAAWSGRPLTSQLEHKTWAPGRKFDRKDFDAGRSTGIALTRKWADIVKPTPIPIMGEPMAAFTFSTPGKPMRLFVDGTVIGFDSPARRGVILMIVTAAIRKASGNDAYKIPNQAVSLSDYDYITRAAVTQGDFDELEASIEAD